uniref:Cry X protein n=1 Tax=Bacillus thuringiensis TaxID=1428 RepID=Q45734_BACTU|nr:cry X [Bacillus thuringiensis serovar galleriae]
MISLIGAFSFSCFRIENMYLACFFPN